MRHNRHTQVFVSHAMDRFEVPHPYRHDVAQAAAYRAAWREALTQMHEAAFNAGYDNGTAEGWEAGHAEGLEQVHASRLKLPPVYEKQRADARWRWVGMALFWAIWAGLIYLAARWGVLAP